MFGSKSPGFVDTLEKRQMLAVDVTRLNVDDRLDQQGRLINSHGIRVSFSGPVQLLDASKIQLRGEGVNPLSGRGQRFVIQVSNARLTNNNTVLQFDTEHLVARRGFLYLYTGGLRDLQGNDVKREPADRRLNMPRGLGRDDFAMMRRQFRPFDFSFFSNRAWPNGTAAVPQTTPFDATTQRRVLAEFLQLKIDQGRIDDAKRNAALADYDNPAFQAIVPSNNLRAALVSLVGTVGEPAINAFLRGENPTGRTPTVLDFSDTLITDPNLNAETRIITDGNGRQRLRIAFNPQFRGTEFQSLSAVLAHEAMHTDSLNSQNEEIIGNAVETVVYAQQLQVKRQFARSPNRLTMRQNERLMMFLNSGGTNFTRPGLLAYEKLRSNLGAFFGGVPSYNAQAQPTRSSFENDLRTEFSTRGFADTNTPTSELCRQILSNITGQTYSVGQQYTRDLIANVDANQRLFDSRDTWRLAGIIKLVLR